MKRTLLWAALVGTFMSSAEAARNQEGVPVTIKVLDINSEPLPTAVIRHPEEADRHRVNSITGEWTAPVLYLPDGGELIFTPGMTIKLEVSAPGFMTQIISYDIRKRRNKVEVTLSELPMDDDDIDEPLIQFGRDKPREVGGSGPAN
ncbi:MAG: hypothetical protein ACI8S6_005800 [Myxococcota bacterium]|jgi:hypothetical protein